MEALAAIEGMRHVIAGALALCGLGLIGAGVAALLRFPDFYTRLQGSALIASGGAALVLIGLAVEAWDARIGARLALMALLIAITAPAISHLLANAAHAAGMAPLVGRKPQAAPPPATKAQVDA